jgi:hypothetical protein
MSLYLDRRSLGEGGPRGRPMKSSLLVVLYLLLALDVSAQPRLTPRPLDALAADTFEQAMAALHWCVSWSVSWKRRT